ncbi:response regulator [Xanthomonas prunicola]|uniref:Two-component system response regulator n=1 Tax=Xanthomonas prunicola TaxID=2053930 RepID=A0A2N3RFG1_9XANT|nr:response regulator [Xanthomonas prunicola]PKV11211.1 two-component system response regulator [Xanthomonas prunicola]PKV15431.1 two-component system response regulator [Xanthomonas prunicola]PKV19337.1 two-component system response regulator [Xanthomonas prunicola]
MLVEDDDAIREMAADILGEEGYHVVASADAEQALSQLSRACPFDLLLSDICLPGMNGRDLADKARLICPALPIVFMTGYAGEIAKRVDFLGTGMRLLTKPFSLRDLLGIVRKAL